MNQSLSNIHYLSNLIKIESHGMTTVSTLWEKKRDNLKYFSGSLSRGMFHFTENGLSETSLCSSAFCPAGPRWKVLSLDRHRFVRMFEKDQAPKIFKILIIFMIIVIIMLNPDVKFSNCPLCFCKISHFGFVIS